VAAPQIAECLAARFAAHIAKPVQPEVLAETLAAVTGRL